MNAPDLVAIPSASFLPLNAQHPIGPLMPTPIFRTTRAALAFTFNFSMQQYDRPLMNKMVTGQLRMSSGESRGLSGLDGSGQAGMIRAELAKLTPLQQFILIARVAPHSLPCGCGAPCCMRSRPNFEWQEAISRIAGVAASQALPGCVVNPRLLFGVVARVFGAKVELAALAKKCDVHPDTASNHHGKVKAWLVGVTGNKKKEAVIGLEQIVTAIIDARLQEKGLVGEEFPSGGVA